MEFLREKVKRKTTGFHKNKLSEYLQCYGLILPQFIGLFVFTLYPVLWVFKYVWYDFDGVNAVFTGLENLIRVFTRDVEYWKSLVNTFVISFGKLIIELPLALVAAVVVNSQIRGKTVFRMIFYMPNVISAAIIGVVFSFLFSSFDGIVNALLQWVGMIDAPINWFGSKWTATAVIVTASIWQGFGVNMLFFLSGLVNIPRELYECSSIDGASKLQQFFRITIPMLAPVLQIICMLAMINGIKIMDMVLVLTNGQPAGSTEVVMTYLFKKFFAFGGAGTAVPQVGYACALGLVTSVIIAIMTCIYLYVTKRMQSID